MARRPCLPDLKFLGQLGPPGAATPEGHGHREIEALYILAHHAVTAEPRCELRHARPHARNPGTRDPLRVARVEFGEDLLFQSLELHDGEQLLHCVCCTTLLPKPEQAAYEDNCQNNESIDWIA